MCNVLEPDAGLGPSGLGAASAMDDDELSPGMSEIVRDLPPPEAPTPPPPAPTIANVEWTPELMHQLLNNGRALANPPSVLQFDARECLDHDPHGIRANEEHCVSCFEAMLEALKAQPVEVERKGSFDDDEEEGAFDDAELEELEAELGGEESSAEQTAALAAPPTSASGPPASPAAPPPVADGTAADAVPSPRPLESLESLESALDSAAVDEAVDTGGCLGFRRRRRRRPRVAPSSSLPATDDTPTVADASASSKKSSRTETAAERQARKDAEAIAAAAAKTAALETKQLQAERDKESKKKAKGAAKRAAERAAAVEEEGRRRRDAEEKREAAFFVRWETITRTEPDNDPIHTAFMRTIMAKVGPLAAEGLQFYINKADLPPIRTVKKTNQRKKRKKQVEIVGGRQGGSVGSASVGSASVSDAGSVGVGGGGGRGGGARPESNEDGSMDGLSMEGSSIDSLDGSVGSNEDGEWGLAELSESPSEDEEDEYTDPSFKLELRGEATAFLYRAVGHL